MATNTLTSMSITPQPGHYALLPNQPIIHTAVVDSTVDTTITPGTILTLAPTGGNQNCIVVKPAAVTDLPVGVVAAGTVKSGYKAGDRISYYPVGSYVYMQAGAAAINRGAALYYNENSEVTSAETAGNSIIGYAMNEGVLSTDVIIVRIDPSTTTAAA